jgi:hypothetical protein
MAEDAALERSRSALARTNPASFLRGFRPTKIGRLSCFSHKTSRRPKRDKATAAPLRCIGLQNLDFACIRSAIRAWHTPCS